MKLRLSRMLAVATGALLLTVGFSVSPAHAIHARLGLAASRFTIRFEVAPGSGQAPFACQQTDPLELVVWARPAGPATYFRGERVWRCSRGATTVEAKLITSFQYLTGGTVFAGHRLETRHNGQLCGNRGISSQFSGRNLGDTPASFDGNGVGVGAPCYSDPLVAWVQVNFTEGIRVP